MNLFFRGDDLFPQDLVTRCVFLGDSGIGAQWALHRDRPGEVIKWDARWGYDVEAAGNTPIEAWLAKQRF